MERRPQRFNVAAPPPTRRPATHPVIQQPLAGAQRAHVLVANQPSEHNRLLFQVQRVELVLRQLRRRAPVDGAALSDERRVRAVRPAQRRCRRVCCSAAAQRSAQQQRQQAPRNEARAAHRAAPAHRPPARCTRMCYSPSFHSRSVFCLRIARGGGGKSCGRRVPDAEPQRSGSRGRVQPLRVTSRHVRTSARRRRARSRGGGAQRASACHRALVAACAGGWRRRLRRDAGLGRAG